LVITGIERWAFLLLGLAVAMSASTCGPSAVINRAELNNSDGAAAAGDGLRLPPVSPERAGGSSGSSSPGGTPPAPIDPPGKGQGFACTDNKGCNSGPCVDGVCCESLCPGTCQSCDQPGSEGRCLPVPEGQDPDDECADEAAPSCGQDGACNGSGACRVRPSGTVCLAGGCLNAEEWAPSLCDGKGTCVAGTRKSCAPAECIGDSCAPPCVMDPDCPTGRWCDAGTCRTTREQGMPCERSAQCGSGFCTDGVCCNMECKDSCYACNQPGALGECKAVPSGDDPAKECRVQAIGTCGNLGGCNGRGACLKHPVGTFCAYGTCMNGRQFENSTCDGMGGCRRGASRSCSPYACNGNLVCWNACANNDQCAPGRTCNIHVCQ
jgi:hypothetical protein